MGRAFCFALALAMIGSAHGQEKPLTAEQYFTDSYAMMRDFGRCHAIQQHLAQFLDKAGKPANAEEMRGYARGAKVVADFATAAPTLELPDDATEAQVRAMQDKIRTNVASLNTIIELETVRQRAFAERGELDTGLMSFCAELSPIQKTFVESLRRDGFFGDGRN